MSHYERIVAEAARLNMPEGTWLYPTDDDVKETRTLAVRYLREGWGQGFMFTNADGTQLRNSIDAERYCALGAIAKASSIIGPRSMVVRHVDLMLVEDFNRILQQVVVELIQHEAGLVSLPGFNDAEGRTAEEVIAIVGLPPTENQKLPRN